MNLLALLSQKGVIESESAKKYEQLAKERDSSYEEVLIDEGIDTDVIRNAISEYYSLPATTIRERDLIDPEVLKYVPEVSAKHYKMVPIRIEDGILEVGIVDPENYTIRDALNFISNKKNIPYRLSVILEQDFKHGLASYENLTGEVDKALDVLEGELESETKLAKKEKTKRKTVEVVSEVAAAEHIKEDAPVTKIVATILRYAVDGAASDIHIEPSENQVQVRFRVDGLLQRSLQLPKKVHSAIVARTKILSSLRLDEKRKPQDGRFSATIDERKIDFRVSILPTNHGEKVVMRILDTERGVRTLEETGVSKHNIDLIRNAIRQPYGIILISGPTGSGKSTTLYAMLSEIDRVTKNVLSLEDPIEYNIDNVSQSQIKPEIGYTFASGLRTALRQDPDVIMVGEIRDKETAQLAIQAALTGHMVLSTIHTNNAVGVIPRLIDMGVDPYLIAPTLRLALAQRLVRRICPNSGRKVPIEGSIKYMIDKEFSSLPIAIRVEKIKDLQVEHVLYAEPTSECAAGTKGRVAVMEAIEIDGNFEKLILDEASEDELYKAARKRGFISMKEDAIMKALEHTIPFDEVNTLGGELLISDEAQKEEVEIDQAVDNQEPETQ